MASGSADSGGGRRSWHRGPVPILEGGDGSRHTVEDGQCVFEGSDQ